MIVLGQIGDGASPSPCGPFVGLRRKVYICSPYRGDVDANVKLAKSYCKSAVKLGLMPIAPHLYFPQFLDDDNPVERTLGLEFGLEILEFCSEIWVCGNQISEGMKAENQVRERTEYTD